MSDLTDPPDELISTTDPVDEDVYRQVMGRFATGVTVLTTTLRDTHYAMTANAVLSVSLDPVLLLASVEMDARFHDAVIESGQWAVSILAQPARAAAEWFAERGRPLHGQLDRYDHFPGPATGIPLLRGALGHIECRTVDTHPAGDHTLVIGHVLSVQAGATAAEALVYYRGRFGALA